MNQQVIAGPYKIIKHSEEHKGLFERAYTLCTTKTPGQEEYHLTVRYYRHGRMVPLDGQGTYSSLSEALAKTALRIQRYGEMKGWSVLGASDALTLEELADKTKLPESSPAVSTSVTGTSSPSKVSLCSASKGIKKASPKKIDFYQVLQKSVKLQKKHGSTVKTAFSPSGVSSVRRSLRLLRA